MAESTPNLKHATDFSLPLIEGTTDTNTFCRLLFPTHRLRLRPRGYLPPRAKPAKRSSLRCSSCRSFDRREMLSSFMASTVKRLNKLALILWVQLVAFPTRGQPNVLCRLQKPNAIQQIQQRPTTSNSIYLLGTLPPQVHFCTPLITPWLPLPTDNI